MCVFGASGLGGAFERRPNNRIAPGSTLRGAMEASPAWMVRAERVRLKISRRDLFRDSHRRLGVARTRSPEIPRRFRPSTARPSLLLGDGGVKGDMCLDVFAPCVGACGGSRFRPQVHGRTQGLPHGRRLRPSPEGHARAHRALMSGRRSSIDRSGTHKATLKAADRGEHERVLGRAARTSWKETCRLPWQWMACCAGPMRAGMEPMTLRAAIAQQGVSQAT